MNSLDGIQFDHGATDRPDVGVLLLMPNADFLRESQLLGCFVSSEQVTAAAGLLAYGVFEKPMSEVHGGAEQPLAPGDPLDD